MTGTKVEAITVYLPERRLTNADLDAEYADWSCAKLARKVGIQERRVAAPGETALDMAVKVSEKLFSESGFDRSEIDFVMLCTQCPEYPLPTSACLLQHRLGIPITCGAIDYNLGCSGFVYGLALARGLVATGTVKNLLLVTSDTYTRYLHPHDRNNRTIFGDAATACLVRSSDVEKIGKFVFGTNGGGGTNLIVKNGGARTPYEQEAACRVSSTGSISNDNYLYMNGPEIFNYVMEHIPVLFTDVLAANGMSMTDMAYAIFHQANSHILKYLRNMLGIPVDKFFIDMTKVGNTVSSSVPIALRSLLDEGKIKPGDKVALIGYGVGYSWGGTILTI